MIHRIGAILVATLLLCAIPALAQQVGPSVLPAPSGASAPPTFIAQKGSVSCTMSSATGCTAVVRLPTLPYLANFFFQVNAATEMVTAGAVCAASYDAATTAKLDTLLPVIVTVSSTTLTLNGRVSGGAVSTAFTFDYICVGSFTLRPHDVDGTALWRERAVDDNRIFSPRWVS
jgi:hypothetical protein